MTGSADRVPAAILAAARRVAEAAGPTDAAAGIIAVGWATVELDRAQAELAPLVPGPWTDASRDALLGAAVRLGPELTPGGPCLVLLEPDTEGRLAASLARRGEGVAAVYVARVADGPVPGDARWSSIAAGPLGPGRLRLGPIAGPHLVALVSPG